MATRGPGTHLVPVWLGEQGVEEGAGVADAKLADQTSISGKAVAPVGVKGSLACALDEVDGLWMGGGWQACKQ